MIPMTERNACVACRGKNLELVFDLPKLPITGLYVKKSDPTRTDLQANTSFLYCYDCGQGQISKVVDPQLQYGDQYWFRTSTSPTAKAGIDFFHDYFEKQTQGRTFQSLVELGCNDLYLLQKIRHRAKECVGIDTIWTGKEFVDGNLTVRGTTDDLGKPDLIISEHTFEHLLDPAETLEHLITSAADGALFFMEVPSLE